MNEWQTVLAAILTGLFAGGGFFGAKGLLDRLVAGREHERAEEARAEREQEKAMAAAVIAMAQTLSGDVMALTRELVKANNASLIQMAARLETLDRDSQNRFLYLKEMTEQQNRSMDALCDKLDKSNRRLSTFISLMTNRKQRQTDPVEPLEDTES